MGGYSTQTTSPLARRAGWRKEGSEVLIEKTMEEVTWVTTLSKAVGTEGELEGTSLSVDQFASLVRNGVRTLDTWSEGTVRGVVIAFCS